jgi:sterol desaturase/sphingolipid hydroxylase (fatty acid hydroxylase superfamily)
MQDWVPHLLAAKGAVVALWLALLFLLERLVPAAARPAGGARVPRNLALFALNAGLSVAVVVPLSSWAAARGLAWRPVWWSGGAGLALDLVLLDLLVYWWHRANHELPWLWRFHEVHHLDRFLDTSSALRFHFGEVLLSAMARAAAIVLLGFPIASVLLFETTLQLAAIFHHSNLRLPPRLEGVLALIVITPSLHWVHHHRVRRDTDSTYGTVLSVWDRLFATTTPTRRTAEMPIGVEGREERPLLQLLTLPFAPRGAPAMPGAPGIG